MMVAYMESYQQVLQRHRRMNMLLCQMGWKEDRNGRGAMFVLGKRIFYKDGQVEEANLAKNVPRAALGFKSHGDLNRLGKDDSRFTECLTSSPSRSLS